MSALTQLTYRALLPFGVQITRRRDPCQQAATLLGSTPVHTVVDGGAFVGTVTRQLGKCFPAAHIHAFEPQPDTFRKLRTEVGDQPRVHLHQCALSDRDGTATFNIHSTPYTSSLLASNLDQLEEVGQVEVDVRSLDSVMEQAGCNGAEVIKLDLQGHELSALRGAERTLDQCLALIVEVNFRPRYNGCDLFEELAGFLGKHQLRLHRFYDIASSETDHGWLHCDALFLRR